MLELAMFSPVDLILTMGFAWSISGIILLIINKKSMTYGIPLILVFTLSLLDNFIKPGMLHPSFTKILFLFSRNSYFLIGPLIWFYTYSLIAEKRMNIYVMLLHITPFLFWVIQALIAADDLLPPIRPIHIPPKIIIRDLSSILSRVIYSVFILVKIIKRSKSIKNFYSNLNIRNTLFWLYYLIIFYVVLFLMDTLVLLLPLHNPAIKNTISMIVRITPSILFIFLFSLFAQNQEVPKDKKPEKYKKSGNTEGNNTELFKKIENYLTINKIYLDPDFNLDLLVEHIGETRHKISEAINQEYNDNFYAYINGLRLKEFLHVVETDKFPNYTIIAIAYECGFKSTSAFYAYFKKVTGKTPKQYLAVS